MENSGVPHSSLFEPVVLFNISVNGIDSKIESTLSKFVDDTN